MKEPTPQEWIKAYAKVQQVADREVVKALRQAVRDVDAQLKKFLGATNTGAVVRAEQLRVVKVALLEELSKLYSELGNIIAANQAKAAAAAVQMGTRVNAILFAAAGDAALATALEVGMLRGLKSTIDIVVTRMTQSKFPLSERIYKSEVWASGVLENKINSALARGLSAREFAGEVRDFYRPDTPGGARYASMRLARTELNNAFHAASVNNVAGAPWVDAMKWHLSRSHPKADDCDPLATEDKFDLGPGVFPVKEVPRKPHPQCFCVATPVVVDEDEFINSLLAGRYDDYINKTTGVP